MARVELTLISKPGCHLCDDAREVLAGVVGEFAVSAPETEITVSELSIFDDPALYDEYVEDIPVVLVNGRVHTFWRVDPARLRSALLGAS
ncbi:MULTISPECIES: glutaredoxin family protein [Subtercola]|uniref:Glutaredoxin family protein n=1 Tax=Subtercola vilae TaxID=2056433 RepID=A0A4T2C8Q6_9MICO|nr:MULTISPECIES: glutaredoxin family protein [Subtercola]MEA9984746.1 glutaredoxin family protein [Subtercola sp. RTI3]TIH39016.1 glutaredoxin family protein [Subtercola vilae]